MTDTKSKLLSMLEVAKKANQDKWYPSYPDTHHLEITTRRGDPYWIAHCDTSQEDTEHIAQANPQAFTAIVESLIEALEALEKIQKLKITHYEDCESLIDEEGECDCGIEMSNDHLSAALGSITARLEGL